MKNVVNCRDRQDAIDCASLIKRYYKNDVVAIVDMHGKWGYIRGKTMAKINRLVSQGYQVYILKFKLAHNFILA